MKRLEPIQPPCHSGSRDNQRHVPSIFVLVVSAVTLVASWAIYSCYQVDMSQSGSWGCEMSWMSPSYHLLDWAENSSRYALYLYREQGWDVEETLGGHPVIFVPGNAGSYQQVRSIASSASRQFLGHPGGRASGMDGASKLDFFTLDLNEEFSAFHAQTLRDHADFIRLTINHVLRQYDHLPPNSRPSQVTLVAHSMGGVAARLAVDTAHSPLVDTVLTLSTPHMLPPLTLEYGMDAIYQTINTKRKTGDEPLLLSLCGGVSDTQVVSDSCALPSWLVPPGDGLAVFTTGLEGAWTGVDHQAMVWCHQVRSKVARTLLEMTRASGRAAKLQAARYQLLGGLQSAAPSRGLSSIQQQFPATAPSMTVLGQTFNGQIRISHCDSQENCKNVSPAYSVLPRPSNPNAPFPLPGEGVRDDEKMIAADLTGLSEGSIIVRSDDGWFHTGAKVHEVLNGKTWVQTPDTAAATHISLDFQRIQTSSLLTHTLEVVVGNCTGFRPIIKQTTHPAKQLQSSTFESRYFPASSAPMTLHSHVGAAPFMANQHTSYGILVEVFQSPTCPALRLEISPDFGNIFAKIVTRHRMTALAWPSAWSAVTVLWQMKQFHRDGQFPQFDMALKQVGWNWAPTISGFLWLGSVLQSLLAPHLPVESLFLGTTQLLLTPLTGIMAGLTFGVLCCVWAVFCSMMWLSQKAMAWYPTGSSGNRLPDERKLLWREVLPASLALGLVYLVVPQQLVFVAAFAIMWLLTAMLPDEKYALRNASTSILIIMLFLLPFKAPSLVVWGRSLWTKWGHPFSTDHNIIHVAPAIAAAALCNTGGAPKNRNIAVNISKGALFVYAVGGFVAGSRWTWLLPPLANVALAGFVGILW